MLEIAFEEIQKYYGANQVLRNVTFEVRQGEIVGLLGKNGAGKTTLFRILSGGEGVDGGRTMIRKGAVIGLLDQVADYPRTYTVHDVLQQAFEQVRAIGRRLDELAAVMEKNPTEDILRRYGELQMLYEAKGGYHIQDSIHRICTGLKIDETMVSGMFSVLSGGEKTRVMLAKLILESPDVLLLDEPTNHLDLDSMEWLEDYLKAYKGTVIIISHDRYFLDKVVDRIVEIVDGEAHLYAGNYSYFLREKQARYESQLEKYEKQQKEIKRLEEAAKRMHEWARRADNEAMHKRAFNIEKRIERMEKTEKPRTERNMSTRFSETESSSKDILEIQGLCKSYGEKKVLDHLNFRLQKDQRVAIIGANGCGKSTLLKIVVGEETGDSGLVQMGSSVKYAYLPQIVEFTALQKSILDTVMETLRLSEGSARNLLAKYRFRQDEVFKTVENLSGGEKSRLQLCLMMDQDVNLLILDEPTNHLDIESREWLEEALQDFGGVLVFVSHDRYFINKFGNRVVEIAHGKAKDYGGNYEYYKERKVLEEVSDVTMAVRLTKDRREPEAKSVVRISKRKKEELEAQIRTLEDKIDTITREMEELVDHYETMGKLYEEKLTLEADLEKLYEEWFALCAEENATEGRPPD